MDKESGEQKESFFNPLPYIISFAILFLIAIASVTWVLGVYYKANQCVLNPNIWCADDWRCNKAPCFTGPSGAAVSHCFGDVTGPTGLASCLYGPKASGAQLCVTPPENTGGVACNCVPTMETAANCFMGCVQGLTGANISCPCCNPKGKFYSKYCLSEGDNNWSNVCQGYPS